MCGIVGFMDHKLDRRVLEAMMNRIIHRGPDGSGMYLDSSVALGHRRLAIIDVHGGAQPMSKEHLVCIFNGEIYNYRELRNALEEKGHVFQTQSDTEVLLHGYEVWGEKLPEQLRGMFAFAIWDRKNKELFAARDYFGIKPFYYYQNKDSILFGSEIKSFLEHPGFEKKLNRTQLELYLTYQYSPGDQTFFENVYKLPPAHSMLIKDHHIELKRYWYPRFETKEGTLEEWKNKIHEKVMDSVRVHEISDVEIGSFLSSGVDSSYITSLSHVNKTFTIGFSDERYDEAREAQLFSQSNCIWNKTCEIQPQEFWESLPKIQYHMDEPLGDAAGAALYFLNREAAQYVKVCLSGEGADELFAGYHMYREPFTCGWYDRIPLWIRRSIGEAAALLPPVRGVNFLVRHSRNRNQRYIGNTVLFSEKQKKKLLKQYEGKRKPESLSRPFYEELDHADPVTRMQFTDLHLWMEGDILLKADKMSMANSLELRVPFLDKEVFELARQIPTRYKVNKNETKIALRKAVEIQIGNNAGKKKLGFPVPVREWLRKEPYSSMVRTCFQSQAAKEFFHVEKLLKLLDEHVSGTRDRWREIWCIYMFLIWYEVYFEKE